MKMHTEETISASHHLLNYDGKCAKLHGHNFRVVVDIIGKVNPATGMIIDFGEVKSVIEKLDHEDLNNFIENPTAENITNYLINKIKDIVSNSTCITIRVYETEKNWVEETLTV